MELADAADEITMERFRADDLVVETKPDMTPVSEADRAVERRMRERVSQRHPGDVIFGEEYGGDGAGARRWIVDPIDGTKGYVRGMPVWATLLALEQDGELVVSVVSAPAMGRRWWATKGRGAFTNRDTAVDQSRPLRVSGVRRPGRRAAVVRRLRGVATERALRGVARLGGQVLAHPRLRRLLAVHARRRGQRRDLRRPDSVRVGRGGADARRAGGGRHVHRPHGCCDRRRRQRRSRPTGCCTTRRWQP